MRTRGNIWEQVDEIYEKKGWNTWEKRMKYMRKKDEKRTRENIWEQEEIYENKWMKYVRKKDEIHDKKDEIYKNKRMKYKRTRTNIWEQEDEIYCDPERLSGQHRGRRG